MQSFIHTLRWPAMLFVAMSASIISVANLQAQNIPPKLAGSDRMPPGLQIYQADTERSPNGPPSRAQLVGILSQRGVSVDARTRGANHGKQKLRGLSRVPSEFNWPADERPDRAGLQRPSQAALMQRMRQIPGGQAKLDEARRRGAPLGTSTGQVPRSGGGSYGLASAEMASVVGPTWVPLGSELSPTVESGDWSAFFSVNRGQDGTSSMNMYGVQVIRTNIFLLPNGGCLDMWLNVPSDGWYIIYYLVKIPFQAKWVVKSGDGTLLATFTGDGTAGTAKFYPAFLEMGRGSHQIRACNPTNSGLVRYYMSGAYDFP